jgi:hypothetical protein
MIHLSWLAICATTALVVAVPGIGTGIGFGVCLVAHAGNVWLDFARSAPKEKEIDR